MRRAEETIAESQALLRESDAILARVDCTVRAGQSLYVDSIPTGQHDYWLYAYGGNRRLIGPPVAVPASDDDAAIAYTDAHVADLNADLIDGNRLVCSLPAAKAPDLNRAPPAGRSPNSRPDQNRGV